MNGHTAVIQVDVVEKVLGELNVLQRERNWSVTRMYHISFSFFFFFSFFKATGQFLFVLVHQPSFLGSRFSPHSYDVHSSFLQSLFPRSLPHPSCLSPTSLPSPVSLCGLGCFGSCFFFSSPRIHPLDDSSFLVPSSSHPQMFIPPLCDLHCVQYQYIWLPILH